MLGWFFPSVIFNPFIILIYVVGYRSQDDSFITVHCLQFTVHGIFTIRNKEWND